MKLLLCALATLGLNAAAAELKVLKNYDKVTKKYSAVVVSTTDKPLAVSVMLSEVDGLCYVGTPADVEALVESMAVIANASAQDDLVYLKPKVMPGATGLALTLPYLTNWEKGEWTWSNIPKCVR